MSGAAPYPLSGLIEHPTLGQVQYQIQEVPDDSDQQVEATVNLMRQYAGEDAADPTLQADVSQAWRTEDPITDTWEYGRRNGTRGLQFVRDESTGAPFEAGQQPGHWRPVVETLARPSLQAMLSNPQGDCDDFAMYGAAHLIARGVPVAFATVAADPNEPDVYSHIYLVAYPQTGPYAGMRVPIDLSHGPYLGWEYPNAQALKFQEWPVGPRIGLLGLSVLAAGAYLIYRAFARRPN